MNASGVFVMPVTPRLPSSLPLPRPAAVFRVRSRDTEHVDRFDRQKELRREMNAMSKTKRRRGPQLTLARSFHRGHRPFGRRALVGPDVMCYMK